MIRFKSESLEPDLKQLPTSNSKLSREGRRGCPLRPPGADEGRGWSLGFLGSSDVASEAVGRPSCAGMRGLVAGGWAEADRASVPEAGGLAVWVQGRGPALCPTLGSAGPGKGFLARSGCTVHCEIRFKWARPSRIGSAGVYHQ